MIMTPSEWRELVDEAARNAEARERLVQYLIAKDGAYNIGCDYAATESWSSVASDAQSNNTSDSERK